MEPYSRIPTRRDSSVLLFSAFVSLRTDVSAGTGSSIDPSMTAGAGGARSRIDGRGGWIAEPNGFGVTIGGEGSKPRSPASAGSTATLADLNSCRMTGKCWGPPRRPSLETQVALAGQRQQGRLAHQDPRGGARTRLTRDFRRARDECEEQSARLTLPQRGEHRRGPTESRTRAGRNGPRDSPRIPLP